MFALLKQLLYYHCLLTLLDLLFSILCLLISRTYNKYFWEKTKPYWTIITGCTDGIGKEIAILLAKKQQKLCLIARNQSKLDSLNEELSKHTKTKTLLYDFKSAPPSDLFNELDCIGLLINNAGVSSDHPCYFEEDKVNEIIQTNILSTSLISSLAIKKMVSSGRLVFVSSILANNTAPLLATYSASKQFIKHLSYSLNLEQNLKSECVIPGYVATKMSKIKKSSYFVPSAAEYAQCLVDSIGCFEETVPYFPHLVINWVYKHLPRSFFGKIMKSKLGVVRKQAMRKKVQ